jgi:hypothetical protein
MFPEIPESLAGLSASDLKSLAAQYKAAVKAWSKTDDFSAEAAEGHLATLDSLAKAQRKAELAEQIDDLADEAPEEEPDEVVVEEEDDDEDEVEDEPEVKAAAPARKVRTTTGTAHAEDAAPGPPRPSMVLARDGIPGKQPGEAFGSWTEVAAALAAKASNVRDNTSEKFEVGAIPGRFTEDQILTTDPLYNLRMFERAEELTAACDPVIPTFDLACMNATDRPVAASLRKFRPERAGISVYPSPTLQDVISQGNGVGLWTFADDANPAAEKDCAIVQCGTPTEFRWYGIYRCLTVTNMQQMVLPELVEAYLNRLTAWYARTAEVQLLEAMGSRASIITAPTLGYGASVSVVTTLLNYLALYQEQQRWDVGEMDAWLPRWFLYAAKMDLARRNRTDGSFSVASDAVVNGLFTVAGVTPHFFRDTPSWAQPIPTLQTSGLLGQMPRDLDVLVAPRGKFVMMDRGELSIGVTGNGRIRDITSLMNNTFTMFFENFEGVADMDSCPAHILSINNLCYNGQQIAPILIDCEGNDYAAQGS